MKKWAIRVQVLVDVEPRPEESFDALSQRLEHEARLWADGLEGCDIEDVVVESGWWEPGSDGVNECFDGGTGVPQDCMGTGHYLCAECARKTDDPL
jgi:hypothetical protein